MTIVASTTHPVFRHRQDTGVSCGRACGQMIISSLSQAGSAANALIAVEQETLRTRETNKIDIEHWWFTEPDELCALLQSAPELTPADQNWRVAAHSSANKLLADLILAIQVHGRPAAVTTGTNEHWMVLAEVQKNTLGQQVFVFLNPIPSSLPVDTQAGNIFQHQYMDAECGLDQKPMIVVNRGNELADLNLKIGGFTAPKKIHIVSPPGEHRPGAKLPPPSGVGAYTGKAVGVVFGAPPPATAITQLARELKAALLPQLRVMAANPIEVVRVGWQAQLRQLVATFDIKAVQRTLLAADLAMVDTRLVEDLSNPNSTFVLCSGYSNQLKSGFIAAFDPSSQAELLHMQVTDDLKLVNSLKRFPGERTYWTASQTSHFPPLAMPYFVFRRSPGDPALLTRLYDDAEGVVMRAGMP